MAKWVHTGGAINQLIHVDDNNCSTNGEVISHPALSAMVVYLSLSIFLSSLITFTFILREV